ncbi:MAG: kelch repeat-containing protein [Ginsengibacter sp.]
MNAKKTNMNAFKKYIHSNLLVFSIISFTLATLFSSCKKSDSTSDTIVGDWKRSSEFDGAGRTEAITFNVNDKVYLGGGFDGTNRLNDFWVFNISAGYWQQVADFPGTPRNSAVAFTINDKAYVGTGSDADGNKLKDFWEYDPSADTWTRKADFGGTARYGAVGFSINDKGYISTGYDGSYLKDLWEYNPTSDSWTQKASLGGSKRSDAVVFVYNNKAYIVTGFNNGSYLNDFWAYEPASDSWEEKRKINDVSDETYDDDYGSNILRSNAAVFVLNNKAYLTCGSHSGIIGTTWEYNIDADTWNQKTSFEGAAREGTLGFSIDGRGFIVSGNNSSYYFDDLWEFSPDADQDDNNN